MRSSVPLWFRWKAPPSIATVHAPQTDSLSQLAKMDRRYCCYARNEDISPEDTVAWCFPEESVYFRRTPVVADAWCSGFIAKFGRGEAETSLSYC
jgi:hypothetical protein